MQNGKDMSKSENMKAGERYRRLSKGVEKGGLLPLNTPSQGDFFRGFATEGNAAPRERKIVYNRQMPLVALHRCAKTAVLIPDFVHIATPRNFGQYTLRGLIVIYHAAAVNRNGL